MGKFLVHHYDRITKEYLRSGIDAQENPKHPGQPLVPANATVVEPPEVGANEKAIWMQGEWIIVTDHRGTTYYNKVTREEVKLNLGDELDSDTLTSIKPEMDQVWDDAENKWAIPLEVLRQKKDEEIRFAKWRAIEDGFVEYQGLQFHTDEASKVALIFARDGAALGELTPFWQAKDGVLPITDVQQLVDIGLLVGKFTEAQFGKQFTLLSALAEATTPEEIAAIQWSDGNDGA